MIKLNRELNGKILDIGGGGEGIIGRLYTHQVTAIDIRQSELDEAPGDFEKVVMDATNLKFSDGSLDHVTSFFSLMFMNAIDQAQAISEAARVLKCGGSLHIWDCDIVSAYPEPFCVNVVIELPDETISTTYGIKKSDAQSKSSFIKMCSDVGLALLTEGSFRGGFYLRFGKR